ncbi:MAG: DHH family phosphoesterase [Candidatus Nomurabacteria bacterium]|jgi:phosphoesterase RecJ-like protein|nr:DHH family phosphoesterase [Candidatus Nomurabacteria bacterium]
MNKYANFATFIAQNHHICVVQAENPDGDSLGSALALEEVLSSAGNEISLYCPVNIPKYLRYFSGWGRVVDEFDFACDAIIIVDTVSEVLLSKLLQNPAIKNALYQKPVFAIDHHETAADLQFDFDQLIEPKVATGELIYDIATELKLTTNPEAASCLYGAIQSDTLGLTSQNVTSDVYRKIANLIDMGVIPAEFEEKRRDLMKKSARILSYKADLIKRVEYHFDGKLATVFIPWEDIREFSDEYNPNVLILEELRLVDGVDVAVAIKTYPDGKLTAKIRSTVPVAEQLASYFGGGGHSYAAGLRIYESYEQFLPELVNATSRLLAL